MFENEQLRADKSRLEVDATPEEVSQDQTEEYCMPKEHVKRVAKALSFSDKDIECQNVSLDVAQYNLSAECYVYGNTELKQCKVVIDIKTDNTNDELAAFVTYRIRMGLNSYIKEEIDNGCENVVTVINDKNGEPIAVWLAYENNGNIEHDMDVVNTDVLKSVDNVIQDYSKWKLTQNDPIDLKDTLSESVESSATTETSDAQADTEQYNKEHILSLGYVSHKTEDGSTWYLENYDASTFITYPTDIGYELDDNAAMYLFADMADIIIDIAQSKSEMFPTAMFVVCETDGTPIATSLLSVLGEGNIVGIPLLFYGDYEYLNYTEATQLVQSAWNNNAE